MPGPVPKRSDQRRRTNKDTGQVTKAAGAARVVVPAAAEEWHPIATRWYEALAASGQAAFYEPSDWAMAFFVAEAMSRTCWSEKMSAQMFASISEASTRLLVTEGDRRRMKLELERHNAAGDVDEDAAVTSIDAWRERLGS